MRLVQLAGEKAQRLMAEKMNGVDCELVQCDEIWSFVGKKQKRVRYDDSPELGDQYVLVAIDTETKLVPCFTVGKRDWETTDRFIHSLAERVNGRIQITTDAFKHYPEAIEWHFGSEVDYVQMHKIYGHEVDPGRERYSPSAIIGTNKETVQGNPDEELATTSHVERAEPHDANEHAQIHATH